MNKIFFLLITVFFGSSTFAQTDSVINYSDVVMQNGITQTQLFSRARLWYDNTFKDPKRVISINDKETGELTGSGVMQFEIAYQGRKNTMVPVVVEFKTSIRVKDGKYKYDFSDFNVIRFWGSFSNFGILRSTKGKDWFGTKKWSSIAYEETKTEVDLQIQSLTNSLKKEMGTNNDF